MEGEGSSAQTEKANPMMQGLWALEVRGRSLSNVARARALPGAQGGVQSRKLRERGHVQAADVHGEVDHVADGDVPRAERGPEKARGGDLALEHGQVLRNVLFHARVPAFGRVQPLSFAEQGEDVVVLLDHHLRRRPVSALPFELGEPGAVVSHCHGLPNCYLSVLEYRQLSKRCERFVVSWIFLPVKINFSCSKEHNWELSASLEIPVVNGRFGRVKRSHGVD
mmetsp:Transcript_19030/g.32284  ORF Transcript_19030/g.32284 Transcript_19030/m.32284 type:complete len:224 (+) Transcript_19030:109-780(+)